MFIPKKSMGWCYAIGGGLAVLAGFRDLYLPGFLSTQARSAPVAVAAKYHFAIAIVLFLIAWVLMIRARD